MRLARSMSHLSTCRRLAVGCAIVSDKLSRVVAVGYNGPPVGATNDSCTGVPGSCGCVHSEANALVKAGSETGDVYVTHSPCVHCAGMIANAGGRVRRVVYEREFRDRSGLERLVASGVEVARYSNVVPSRIVLGERANGEASDRDGMTVDGWWRSSIARGAFLDATSVKKLRSIGVDLTTTRSANLMPPSKEVGSWEASEASLTWLAAIADQPGATWLACGRRVWETTTGRRGGEFGDEVETCGARVILIPHPSGLSRWWNDRGNPTRLRRRLAGYFGS